MTKSHPIHGMLAEFDSERAVLDAARRTASAGYRKTEAYTPLPVEGLAEALGQEHLTVAPAVFWAGVFGACLGFGMCWYANVLSFTWNVGGRPPDSWPAFIPITFELMVLCASLGAVIAMVAMNRLPQPYHPVFNAPAFNRASKDRFFLCIEATDPNYDSTRTRAFLESLQPLSITEVSE